eukprot:304170-Prorocentrum_minimum.AAC.1
MKCLRYYDLGDTYHGEAASRGLLGSDACFERCVETCEMLGLQIEKLPLAERWVISKLHTTIDQVRGSKDPSERNVRNSPSLDA